MSFLDYKNDILSRIFKNEINIELAIKNNQ